MFRELSQEFQALNDEWLSEIKLDCLERQQSQSKLYNFDFETSSPGPKTENTIFWSVSEKEPLGVGKLRKTFLDFSEISSFLSNIELKFKN
jgi:hypothetical protein